jgi:beta-lactam-binding protein with PASTA domain
MVPDLTGADQSSVDLLLSRSHLITGKVTSVVSLARAGTVIAENSPAGTIEPSSSIVDVTISAGGAAVPELESLTQGQATRELAALGLATRIIQTRQCADPGLVTGQTPIAGTVVALRSTVTITVNRGPLHPC